MDLEGSKSSKIKNEVFRAGKKSNLLAYIYIYVFLLHYESVNNILTFSKNKMFGKNLILQLRSKNLWTNQNARFFKLEYFTNKLKYVAELFDVTRGP